MLKKSLLAGLFLISAILSAWPQAGQFPSGYVQGNSTALAGQSSPSSVTAILDRALASTRGSIVERGSGGWGAVPPSAAAGLPWVGNGTGADPAYQLLGLVGGGTNAALTASNGGIVYSTGSALAILAGTSTANQIPLSGSNAAPTWSTAVFASSYAASAILYSNGANNVAALAPCASGVLIYSAGSVPSCATTLPSSLTIPSALLTGTPTVSGAVTFSGIPLYTGLSTSGTCANSLLIQAGGAMMLGACPSTGSPSTSVKTANYTLATGDCWSTVQYGTGSTGQLTATLPSTSGFAAGCTIFVKNGDTYPGGRGKILSGFPSDLNSILWPQQTLAVQVVNGAWVTIVNPGRWKVPSQVTLHVLPSGSGGSDSNDGLASGSGNAVADPQTAWNIQQYQFDNQGTSPIIAMACSVTHTAALNMGGTPLGTNLVQLSPDGNCSATWTNASPCIALSDLAELNLDLNYYGSSGTISFQCNQTNAASTGNILEHNDVVLDQEGTPVWTSGGANDGYLFCDGMCQFTISNGLTQAGAGGANYIINMSAGGHGTQSGVISASASGGANGVYWVFGGTLSLGTSNGSGWSSMGTSKIYAHGQLITNGVTVAGSTSTTGGTGAVCTSLTAAC